MTDSLSHLLGPVNIYRVLDDGSLVSIGPSQGGVTFSFALDAEEVALDETGTQPITHIVTGMAGVLKIPMTAMTFQKYATILPGTEIQYGPNSKLYVPDSPALRLDDYAIRILLKRIIDGEETTDALTGNYPNWVTFLKAAPIAVGDVAWEKDAQQVVDVTFMLYADSRVLSPLGKPTIAIFGTPPGAIGPVLGCDAGFLQGIQLDAPTPNNNDVIMYDLATNTWVAGPGGGGGGEVNTGSNVNVGGVGVFDGKVGVDLQFRGVASTTNRITSVLSAPNNRIDLTLVEGNIDHTAIQNIGVHSHAQIDSHLHIFDAAGDLLYASAADTWARLAVGTGRNLFLSPSGGLPVWRTFTDALNHKIFYAGDYATLQAAVTAAMAVNGTVICESKTYTEAIAATSPVSIHGAGRNSTIIDSSGLADHAITISSSRVSIQDLSVKAPPGTPYAGIKINAGNYPNIGITNVDVIDAFYGIHDTGYGLFLELTRVHVDAQSIGYYFVTAAPNYRVLLTMLQCSCTQVASYNLYSSAYCSSMYLTGNWLQGTSGAVPTIRILGGANRLLGNIIGPSVGNASALIIDNDFNTISGNYIALGTVRSTWLLATANFNAYVGNVDLGAVLDSGAGNVVANNA